MDSDKINKDTKPLKKNIIDLESFSVSILLKPFTSFKN